MVPCKLALLAMSMMGVLATCEAVAEIVTFTSRDSWISAVGPHEIEDFESVEDLLPIPLSGGVFSTEHFEIVVDQNHGRIGPATKGFFIFPTPGLDGVFFVGDVHGPSTPPPHFNTIHFIRPISAFAANFAAFDDGGVRNILIGEQSFDIRGDSQFGAQFFGVTSSKPFSIVDIRNLDPVLERFGMDNVSFKFVPEPTTFLLALVGVTILASKIGERGAMSSRTLST